jgi:hypothetical protein
VRDVETASPNELQVGWITAPSKALKHGWPLTLRAQRQPEQQPQPQPQAPSHCSSDHCQRLLEGRRGIAGLQEAPCWAPSRSPAQTWTVCLGWPAFRWRPNWYVQWLSRCSESRWLVDAQMVITLPNGPQQSSTKSLTLNSRNVRIVTHAMNGKCA